MGTVTPAFCGTITPLPMKRAAGRTALNATGKEAPSASGSPAAFLTPAAIVISASSPHSASAYTCRMESRTENRRVRSGTTFTNPRKSWLASRGSEKLTSMQRSGASTTRAESARNAVFAGTSASKSLR